jgi:hypothetical protein
MFPTVCSFALSCFPFLSPIAALLIWFLRRAGQLSRLQAWPVSRDVTACLVSCPGTNFTFDEGILGHDTRCKFAAKALTVDQVGLGCLLAVHRVPRTFPGYIRFLDQSR